MERRIVPYSGGPSIGIAGAGRVAQALGKLLRDRGEPVVAIAGRDPQRTQAAAAFLGPGVEAVSYRELPTRASRLLIAVPDDALEHVCGLLAESGIRSGTVLHTCGNRGPEAMAVLAECGVSCATLHPLQTVASPEQGLSALPRAAFAITGSGAAADWAYHIAALLEGEVLKIPASSRPLYHAAAVMAGNYVTAVIDAAVILMGEAGIEKQQAIRALAPLIRTSMENALNFGPVQALTGPIERGDAGTVAEHMRALSSVSESVRELYRAAGLHALEMARRKSPGVDRAAVELALREGEL